MSAATAPDLLPGRQSRLQLQTGVEMQSIIQTIGAFVRDEEGVTAIEYGLIATLIALAIVVGVTSIGTNLEAKFMAIAGYLT
ncbi:pilus assembly protein Flp/PilA [Paraburkholderia phenoliruptrix BR3459a]|uniref:Pilus assembly protein Flp/PilA n=2 Tax=Paraburkholderia phenoliruptrix TaxID=252970 RepID=K0DWN7_9BURK|nr:pilus assembly protein Flp/PilA [Paraburkholderia phenoliruptrix BR3459a]